MSGRFRWAARARSPAESRNPTRRDGVADARLPGVAAIVLEGKPKDERLQLSISKDKVEIKPDNS
jgi:hypothetical protein